jgi:hypothetical protein
MTWCEACRDHFDEDHYVKDYVMFDGTVMPNGAHGVGPQYGPAGADMVKLCLVDLIIGKGSVLWEHDERSFEVRHDGKHVGFIEVTESGEVVWIS